MKKYHDKTNIEQLVDNGEIKIMVDCNGTHKVVSVHLCGLTTVELEPEYSIGTRVCVPGRNSPANRKKSKVEYIKPVLPKTKRVLQKKQEQMAQTSTIGPVEKDQCRLTDVLTKSSNGGPLTSITPSWSPVGSPRSPVGSPGSPVGSPRSISLDQEEFKVFDWKKKDRPESFEPDTPSNEPPVPFNLWERRAKDQFTEQPP
jgi:hypothetical protein